MGFTIVRLSREREQDMTNIRVAVETYYLHNGKAFKRGQDVPSGASLLVRKGSPILPAVAEQYGVETEDAQNVVRVPNAGATPLKDRGVGVSMDVKDGLKRLDVTEEVHRETVSLNTQAQTGGAGTSRQAAMLRNNLVEERIKEGTGVDPSRQVIEPGTREAQSTASSAGGFGGAPINEEITKQLEEGEIAATAKHTRAAMTEAHREPETEEERKTGDGGGIKPSTMSPESAATGMSSSVTKEIAPGGDQAAAKLAEEARLKSEREAQLRETTQETRPPGDLS